MRAVSERGRRRGYDDAARVVAIAAALTQRAGEDAQALLAAQREHAGRKRKLLAALGDLSARMAVNI